MLIFEPLSSSEGNVSYLGAWAVPVQADGFNSALSPVVYGDIALSIKTQYNSNSKISSSTTTIRSNNSTSCIINTSETNSSRNTASNSSCSTSIRSSRLVIVTIVQ